MTARLALAEVLAATGGALAPGSATGDRSFAGVSTDTRTAGHQELFVALRGPRHDGHRHLAEAWRRGVAGVVIARSAVPLTRALPPGGERSDVTVIVVEDTGRALLELARAHRMRTGVRVVAITGSNGKTSTKDLLAHVCRGAGTTVAAPRSFNNQVGVPLTLLQIGPDTRYCVVEVGTSAPGEVATLARVAAPEIAILTQIAPAHLHGLGDLEGVAREKASLLEALPPDGVAIVNGDDPRCLEAGCRSGARVARFGRGEHVEHRAEDLRSSLEGSSFLYNRRYRVHLPFPGSFHVQNALAVLAAGVELGMDAERVVHRLSSARPPEMRFNIRRMHGVTVVNDAYNANPRSLKMALEELASLAPRARRVAVLGAMRELGDRELDHHLMAGRHAASLVDRLVAVGPVAGNYLTGAREEGLPAERSCLAGGPEEAAQVLMGLVREGDVVLIKGSRAEELERVIDVLRDGMTPAVFETA